jgi:hypothetical protein
MMVVSESIASDKDYQTSNSQSYVRKDFKDIAFYN